MDKILQSVHSINATTPGIEGFTIPEEARSLQNFLDTHPEITRIGEIGFNVGMSCAAMLTVRDDIKVYSFDIGHHSYIQKQKNIIDECFPDRHVLIIGDSTKTLPLLYDLNPNNLFNFIFIDGGHTDPVPYIDMKNSLKLLKPGGYMCIDDYCIKWGSNGVIQAYHKIIEEKLVEPLERYDYEDRGWVYCRKL